jgi:hypothetical protein
MPKASKIDKVFDISTGLIEKYRNNPAFQQAVLMYPEAGPIVHAVLSAANTVLFQTRLTNMIHILNSELQLLDERKIDIPYLETDEFKDLVLQIIQQSIRTRHRERILTFVQILSGSISIDGKKYRSYSEDFVYIISDLTPTDMTIAEHIFMQQKDMHIPTGRYHKYANELKEVKKMGWDNICQECNLDDVSFQLSLIKLSRAGLIRELVGYLDNAGQGTYIITDGFKKFADFIRTTSSQPVMSF